MHGKNVLSLHPDKKKKKMLAPKKRQEERKGKFGEPHTLRKARVHESFLLSSQ